ncbi:MAG: DUF4249 domain-containing protein [Tannerellaceae bacterium]|jgi:hypothetical protein|nr:DUF4249 domain-containing protein [Tannerellaceae bacterium]
MELQLLNPKSSLAVAVFACTLLSGLFSCEERINIQTDASAPRLVIYGYITTDTLQHGVRISRSSDYFSTDKPEGISQAKVSIRHKDEVFTLTESPSEQGYYQTEAGVSGEVGETYTLQVSLDFDGDGQEEAYEASSVLPPVATLDSIAVRPSTLFEHFLEVQIWGRLPEQEENFLSFHLYRDDYLVNDSLQGFSINSDEFLSSKDIIGFPAFYLNQRRESSTLRPGSMITFQIEGITREYGTFILNAQAEARGSTPMFSAPPANLETNILSLSPTPNIRLSGFFTAYSKNQISMIYQP